MEQHVSEQYDEQSSSLEADLTAPGGPGDALDEVSGDSSEEVTDVSDVADVPRDETPEDPYEVLEDPTLDTEVTDETTDDAMGVHLDLDSVPGTADAQDVADT